MAVYLIPFAGLFCWIWFRSFTSALKYVGGASLALLLMISPWLIRTYTYYPDIRIVKALGTSLTHEAAAILGKQFYLAEAGKITSDSAQKNTMAYFYASLDPKTMAPADRERFGDAPEKIIFQRSFNGYYEQAAEKFPDAYPTLSEKVRHWLGYFRNTFIGQ